MQLRISRHIQRPDLVAGAVEVEKFRIIRKIQRRDAVVAANQLGELAIVRHIEGSHTIVGTVVVLEARAFADIDAPEMVVIPDVEALHLRAARHIQRSQIIAKRIEVRKARIVA